MLKFSRSRGGVVGEMKKGFPTGAVTQALVKISPYTLTGL
jgi:hypothetical protein